MGRHRARRSQEGLRIRVLFGSTTGTCKKWAQLVTDELALLVSTSLDACRADVTIEDLTTFAFDSLLEKADEPCVEVVLVLMSTHTDGMPPPACAHFCALLDDHVHDFRVSQNALSHINFAVLGFGSSDYQPAGHYCTAAASVDKAFAALSGRRMIPFTRVSDTEDAERQVKPWQLGLIESIQQVRSGKLVPVPSAADEEGSLEDAFDSGDESDSTTAASSAGQMKAVTSDVEELVDSCAGTVATASSSKREMVTKRHREQLTKEGYKIVGSHSAVKLCRWTKHQLRGRGGCYKHSFYGIESHRCMEATPSLACANKCVFCWRHHTNP